MPPRSGVLTWMTSAAPASTKSRTSSRVLHHSSTARATPRPARRRAARSAAEHLDLAGAAAEVHHVLDAQRQRARRRPRAGPGTRRCARRRRRRPPESAVDVEVQDRHVRGVDPEGQDAVAHPADVGRQVLAVRPELGATLLISPCGSTSTPLEDHLVDVVVAVVPGLDEQPHRAQVRAGVVLVPQHLGHGHPARPGHGVEHRLGHPVAERRVQWCAVAAQVVHRRDRVAEGDQLPADQQRRDDVRRPPGRPRRRRTPRPDHRRRRTAPRRVAVRDLTVVSTSSTDNASAGCRTERKPGVTGAPT